MDEQRQLQCSVRKAWEEYLQRVLPHSRAQLHNFILACMAEGKVHPEDKEQRQRRGASLYCKLS